MNDTCEHGNLLRYGCILCLSFNPNPESIIKDQALKLMINENKLLMEKYRFLEKELSNNFRRIEKLECNLNELKNLQSNKEEKTQIVCPGCNGKGFQFDNFFDKTYKCKACSETGIFTQ